VSLRSCTRGSLCDLSIGVDAAEDFAALVLRTFNEGESSVLRFLLVFGVTG
jgi:hypothetical protein